MLPQKRAIDLLLVTTTLLAFFAAACAGGKPIDVGEPGGDDDDVSDATFTTGAFPALQDVNCGSAGCHTGGAPAGGLQLPDSAGTLAVNAAYTAITTGGISGSAVNTASPENSLILTKGDNSTSHTGGKRWDDGDSEYKIVLAWIGSGAQMN